MIREVTEIPRARTHQQARAVMEELLRTISELEISPSGSDEKGEYVAELVGLPRMRARAAEYLEARAAIWKFVPSRSSIPAGRSVFNAPRIGDRGCATGVRVAAAARRFQLLRQCRSRSAGR
jgi:hypothetical protein